MDQLSPIEGARNNKIKVQAILMMFIAAICFAVLVMLIKFVPDIPLMEIVLFRNIPIMLIVPLILINGNGKSGVIHALFWSFRVAFLVNCSVILTIIPGRV
jgi:EamA domain-containing membrane protein RarD